MELINLNAYVKKIFMECATKGNLGATEFMLKTNNMAMLLDTPLKLWHFTPCDDNMKPLKEPKEYQDWINKQQPSSEDEAIKCLQYYKACERVLFENEPPERLHNLKDEILLKDVCDFGLILKPSVTRI